MGWLSDEPFDRYGGKWKKINRWKDNGPRNCQDMMVTDVGSMGNNLPEDQNLQIPIENGWFVQCVTTTNRLGRYFLSCTAVLMPDDTRIGYADLKERE